MSVKQHWETVYRTRSATEVSWYQSRPARSLGLIREFGGGPGAHVIDVGGGASRLVDHLLAERHRHLTVLDLSGEALAVARERLGDAAEAVRWREGDILSVELPRQAYDVWHDRAVLHFFTDPDERAAYRRQLGHALKPGGHAVIAAFASDGPSQCSGLPVVRYSPETLAVEVGPGLALIAEHREVHTTPAGSQQAFIYCVFRVPAAACARARESGAGAPV